ncbi:MAG: hypothetical protein CVU93_00615 [Firmicutes bacterium HGW-Firmicutes-18]|nr:MAG: hypothetical protein CVU93_00615 [Firmicutes bacterium HGW-Firmicutes-18]
MLIREKTQIIFSKDTIVKIFGISLTWLLFVGPVLFLPISDWDARSIWFLHAKMIYYAGSLSQNSGWADPSIFFSHSDYPNLIPALAAQFTYLFGIWNEYLPKISLLFLLLPAIISVFSFYERSFAFLFLVLIIPISISSKLWNGYMDGYLTFYFALSMLYLTRYYNQSETIDIISSIISLIILVYLKNEGLLAILAGGLAFTLLFIMKKTKIPLRLLLLGNWRNIVIGILLLIPFVIWGYYKQVWGLTNDLAIGSNSSFQQFISRIHDGSYKIILNGIHNQLNNGLMLFGFLFFGALGLRKKIPRGIIFVLFAAFIYCLGIFSIYMITPRDLEWHLRTSIDRTILTVTSCFYIASYLMISAFENKSKHRKIMRINFFDNN